ncbi:hypothetical protein EYZ01_12775 [Hafnia alvei]|uniref:hypothetical protein n=1 Tax=Hafnia alvei TaxID=569 RepID=UPI0010340378|nr:hypothetical protein [Hafnia alvei]TBL38629.1 hypothetical protein EYZ01_12775 [Hafnia alvei]
MKTIYGHLKQQLQGLLPATGKTSSLIDGLELIRRDRAARDEGCIYQPAIEFIVQGQMESLTGMNGWSMVKARLWSLASMLLAPLTI